MDCFRIPALLKDLDGLVFSISSGASEGICSKLGSCVYEPRHKQIAFQTAPEQFAEKTHDVLQSTYF